MPLLTWVEDDRGVQELLKRLLEHWHIPAQGAASAEEGWRLFCRHPTPLVLADVILPGRDGFWLLEQVRQEWPEVIGLVMSGSVNQEVLLRCMRMGVVRCFSKPLDTDELHQVLMREVQRVQHEREQRRHVHELQQRLQQTARQQVERTVQASETLLAALSLYDPTTASHCRRVCQYARTFGRFLRLTAPHLAALDLAARLHDVGKLGVPVQLLHHSAPLSPSEESLVAQHPVWSEQIVRPLLKHVLVLQAIRHHHERWDGKGYPDGLAGQHIPFLARILAIVDAYDAMTSVRPYRSPRSWQDACAELERQGGTQFDPELSSKFVRLVQRQPEWFMPSSPREQTQPLCELTLPRSPTARDTAALATAGERG
ncbi:MAG: response regulator [Gemmatales bacterium]|nr:response regulator [Gemmatales bacterium]MDW8223502.1 HD domain-containing phosphohydrolase [Gemmatales bacterium]